MTDTGQEFLADSAEAKLESVSFPFASAKPSSPKAKTSGQVLTQSPQLMHPSLFTTAFI